MILLAAVLPSCIAVTGGQITALDAAKAVPAFAKLDPATILGLAPTPGARRVFEPAEIARLVGLPNPEPICFEYATAAPDPDVFLESLRQSIEQRYPESGTWRYRVIDYSRHPIPAGPVRFSAGLLAPNQPDGSLLARGAIGYAAGRTFPVWLRVKIEAPITRVHAARAITRGQRIGPSDIEERESSEAAPPRMTGIRAIGISGKVATRDFAAGAVIDPGSLRTPPDVTRGHTLVVEVVSGLAKLSFEARAEANGRSGDRIAVLNPTTGRRFTAIVSGPGKALVAVEGRSRRP